MFVSKCIFPRIGQFRHLPEKCKSISLALLRVSAVAVASTFTMVCTTPTSVRAEDIVWGMNLGSYPIPGGWQNTIDVFQVDLSIPNSPKRIIKQQDIAPPGASLDSVWANEYTGKIYAKDFNGQVWSYDINKDEISQWSSLSLGGGEFLVAKPNGTINLIRYEGNELHIGENSLITVEKNGVQELYAQDANGDPIPINITNGSDLQVNGRSVMGEIDKNTRNINNLGFGVAGSTALVSAMSALPTLSTDSPLSCGTGTGGYSDRYAIAIGCAANINQRVSVNMGGSYVFGGSSDYGGGSLSNVAGKAGFVFKLGEIAKSQSSSKLNEELVALKKENNDLKLRLERLEKAVLRIQK